MAIPTERLQLYLGWSWYRDTNPVSTNVMADGLATKRLQQEVRIHANYRRDFCHDTHVGVFTSCALVRSRACVCVCVCVCVC